MLYSLAVLVAHEVHVILAHRSSGRGHAHQWPIVGAAHGQAARNYVTLGDQLVDLEAQVWEGRAQHGGQPSHRLGAAISSWRSLVVDEGGCDQLFHTGNVPLVQYLLVGAPKQDLVLFCRHDAPLVDHVTNASYRLKGAPCITQTGNLSNF